MRLAPTRCNRLAEAEAVPSDLSASFVFDYSGEGSSSESRIVADRFRNAVSHFFEPVTRRQSDVVERFYALASEWKLETVNLSDTDRICTHSAYQQIIGMGERAVPYILFELKKTSAPWFWALMAITGEDPVPDEHAGRMKLMSQDWLKWGEGRGYI